MGWLYTGTAGSFSPTGPNPIWGRQLEFSCYANGHLELTGNFIVGNQRIGTGSAYTSVANINYSSITGYFSTQQRIFVASTSSATDKGALFSQATTASYHLYFGDASHPASEVTYATTTKGVISQNANDDTRFIGEDSDGQQFAWGPQIIVTEALTRDQIREWQYFPRPLPNTFAYYDPNASGVATSANTGGIPERSGQGTAFLMQIDSLFTTIPYVVYPEPGYHRHASGGCG